MAPFPLLQPGGLVGHRQLLPPEQHPVPGGIVLIPPLQPDLRPLLQPPFPLIILFFLPDGKGPVQPPASCLQGLCLPAPWQPHIQPGSGKPHLRQDPLPLQGGQPFQKSPVALLILQQEPAHRLIPACSIPDIGALVRGQQLPHQRTVGPPLLLEGTALFLPFQHHGIGDGLQPCQGPAPFPSEPDTGGQPGKEGLPLPPCRDQAHRQPIPPAAVPVTGRLR